MKKLKMLVRDNIQVLFLLYWPVYLVVFFTLDWVELDHHLIVSSLDSLIPFDEYFLLIYLAWVPWFSGLSLFFLYQSLKPWLRRYAPRFLRQKTQEVTDRAELALESNQARIARADYIKLSMVMFTGMSLCLITYVVWPNKIDLREPLPDRNLFAWGVNILRRFDSPYNVCPSIHVVTLVSEALTIKETRLRVFTPRVKTFSYVLTGLIVYSTMTLKQHSVVDVFVGAAVGVVLYILYITFAPKTSDASHEYDTLL